MTSSLIYSDVTCRVDRRRKRAALDGFTFECLPGEVTCLLGPNGAGKTTALSTAAGLLSADDGTVQFAGQPVGPKAPPRLMGYLPQQSSFPAVLTAREVVDFSFSARRTSALSRQEILSLTGVERVLDETVGTQSSGWVRRLGLAVALAPPSGLLLLDEPFVGLDLDILDSIIAHLKRLAAEGKTVVLSTHDFEIVDKLGARVAVLEEGKLRGTGGAGTLGARAFYRSILSAPKPSNVGRSDA